MAKENCCYLGRGKISLRKCPTPAQIEAGEADDFIEVGNATSFQFQQNINTLTVKNYQLKCGTECSYDELESVTLSMDLTCHDNGNLEKAFLGQAYAVEAVAEIPSAPVTDTFIWSTGDSLVFTASQEIDTAQAYSVLINATDETANFTFDAAANTFTYNGILNSGDAVEIVYNTIAVEASPAQTKVNLFDCLQAEYELRFDGCNAAGKDGNQFVLNAWRVKLSPASTFDFIGDDFNTFTLTGTLLADTEKMVYAGAADGNVLSPYATLCIVGA